ncbi:MAG: phosphoglycerate kinase [Planktotalea sp.]|jgi:hypothetical protein|uniref:phosphoglycerate kinase n=1 Tax=Planktotalea sp. TaxID=2029877 RepID=UPI003C718A04
MGLDQYAYIKHDEGADDDRAADFVWRKHSKLQAWAETLFTAKTGQSADKLNCAELVLEAADIDTLEALVKQKALPKSDGGFFFGHQFQDEAADENAAQDLAFCAWAKDVITNGQTVVYSCWW